jgi:hypothetical protein
VVRTGKWEVCLGTRRESHSLLLFTPIYIYLYLLYKLCPLCLVQTLFCLESWNE